MIQSLRQQIQKGFSRVVTRYAILSASLLLVLISAFAFYLTHRNLVAQSDLVRTQLKTDIAATLTQADTLVHSPMLWNGLMDSFSHETTLKPLFRQLNRMDDKRFILLDYQGRVSIEAPGVEQEALDLVRTAIPSLTAEGISVQLLRSDDADDLLLTLMPIMSPLSDAPLGYLMTQFSVTASVQKLNVENPLEFNFNLSPDFPASNWLTLSALYSDSIEVAGHHISYDTRYAVSLLPDLMALATFIALTTLLGTFLLRQTELWLGTFAGRLTLQLDQLVIYARDIFAGRPAEIHSEAEQSDEIGTIVRTLESLLADQVVAQERLKKIAYEDSLTGLPIYTRFLETLEGHLSEHAKSGLPLILIFVDINKLKHINDIYGYEIGDQAILEAAAMLQAALPKSGLLSRRSGDEFVALAGMNDQRLSEFTERMAGFEIIYQNIHIPVTLTMGVARYPEDAKNLNDLIFCAEYAHRQAKHRARQSFVIFNQQLSLRLLRNKQIEERIVSAIRQRQIKPYYQPEVDMVTGKISGFETLARWHDPELGWISPDEFLPIVEHLRMNAQLTQCVLAGILHDADLIRERFPDAKIAFNASPQDFHDNQLLETIEAYAAQQSDGLANLELELTEQDVVDLDVDMTAKLNQLINVGIRVAIDDFGTRYSSLSRLTALPLHRLKIDLSFVSNITHDKGEQVVRMIISLARSLNLDITAEGVETLQQRDLLIEFGCRHGQGWLYSKALSINSLIQLPRVLEPMRPTS